MTRYALASAASRWRSSWRRSARCVRGDDDARVVTLEEGLETVRVAEAVLESAAPRRDGGAGRGVAS